MDALELFRFRNYTKLYFAGLASELGSFITDTAVMLFIFSRSGDNKAYLGMTRAIFLFFFTLGVLLGGMLGDKYNRRNVLIVCDLSRIPLILVILAIDDIHIIMLCNGFIAFFTGLFNPSRQALVTELVPPSMMRMANSLFGSTFAVLHIAGPFLGVMVYAETARIGEILIFDLFTYIVGIFLLLKIPFVFSSTGSANVRFLAQLGKTASYIVGRRDLLSLYGNVFLVGTIVGILIPLLLPFVRENLSGDYREYSYLITLFGIGGLFGGVASGRLSLLFGEGRIIVASTVAELFLMNIWIRVNVFSLSACIMFVWGLLVFIRISTQLNYLSKSVDSKYLAQAYSLLDLFYIVPNISGGILVGIIGDSYRAFDFLWLAGVVFAFVMSLRLILGDLKILFKANLEQVDRQGINFR